MDRSEELLMKLEEVPEEMRQAVYWMVKNIDLIDLLTEEAMEPKLLEMYMRRAKNNKEYLLLALLCYQKSRDTARNN